MGPRSLPLWLPDPEYAGYGWDVSASLADGMTIRPIEHTAADALAWERRLGLDRSEGWDHRGGGDVTAERLERAGGRAVTAAEPAASSRLSADPAGGQVGDDMRHRRCRHTA